MKYEFKEVVLDTSKSFIDDLNAVGEEGWQLVTVMVSNEYYPKFIFQREKQDVLTEEYQELKRLPPNRVWKYGDVDPSRNE